MLFGGVFAIVGLGVLAFILPEAIKENDDEAILAAGILGILFACTGFGISWGGLLAQRFRIQREALMLRYPNAPWMWNREWAGREIKGSGNHSLVSEHVLYEEKQEIEPHRVRPGPRGSKVPLQFLIPYDNRDSDDSDLRSRILWRIEVRGDFKGIDYSSSFEVPVFKSDASSSSVVGSN